MGGREGLGEGQREKRGGKTRKGRGGKGEDLKRRGNGALIVGIHTQQDQVVPNFDHRDFAGYANFSDPWNRAPPPMTE